MIFSDQQQGISAVLNGDAYFSASPGCYVFWDGQKEDENKRPLETAKAFKDKLATIGVAGVVTEPEVTTTDGGLFAVSSPSLVIVENPTINRDSTKGTGKTAFQFCAKAWALLADRTLPSLTTPDEFQSWSPLVIEGISPATVNQEHLIAWELKLSSRVMLELVVKALADEFGAVLTDENDRLLIVSPTEP
jgi:hypothetical protein